MRWPDPGAPAQGQAAQQPAATERPAGRAVAGQAAAKLARELDIRCLIQKFGVLTVATAPAARTSLAAPRSLAGLGKRSWAARTGRWPVLASW